MSLADDWQLVSALPYLAGACGILYISIVALGRETLRFRRRQKKRDAPPSSDRAPWNEWLREINERQARTKIDDIS